MANKKKEYYKPGPMTEGKRNIMTGASPEVMAAEIMADTKSLCKCCGVQVPQYPTRKKEKKFCSDACRNKW